MDVSYIDSHAHIYLDQFRGNIDNIIKNSLNNNVHKILMPNINLDTVTDILKVSDQYKEICYPMLGLHPCYIKDNFEYVGENFTYKARSIHYDKKKRKKGIYGSATLKDVRELKEEGRQTDIIPWIEDDKN